MNFKKLMSIVMGAVIVSSVMPVSSAEASIKLEALEGTITDAKAFMGGRYVFDGYKGEDQDNGIYYFNGEKDIEIEDAETMGSKYGMNYINFKEDEILFNLATGQPEEDDEEAKREMLEAKFKSSVMKRAERYENTPYLVFEGKLAENIYSGIWYEYSVQSWPQGEEKGAGDISYKVYINDSGKYVDASEKLNLVYYDKEGNKISLDDYDDLEKNNLIIAAEKGLLIDKENIYRLIILVDTADNFKKTQYVQKISMEQGDKEDGAYVPKNVTSFETYDFDALAFAEGMENGNTARMVGNSLYTIEPSDDSITMKKYTVKKIKDKDTVEGKTLDRKALQLDDDFDDIDDEDMEAFDVDIYANLWVLNKGKIQKAENGKLVTKYEVDRSMNKLSVFDDNNLIVWNTENEIYSVVSPQPVIEEKPEESEEAVDSKEEAEIINGWVKNIDGTWSYTNIDGTKASGWLKDNNTWYYLNAEGIMQTGWIKDGSTWYYLNASGAMQTGWLKDTNGKWYYLYNNGAMAYSTIIDGYKLDASGAWIN